MSLYGNREKLEVLQKRYPQGTKIRLEEMEGEPQMPRGLKGRVDFVDDIGQIHVSWENGSSLALNPDVDRFQKEREAEKRKQGEGLSR